MEIILNFPDIFGLNIVAIFGLFDANFIWLSSSVIDNLESIAFDKFCILFDEDFLYFLESFHWPNIFKMQYDIKPITFRFRINYFYVKSTIQ
jgi:hypothetical protein